MTETTEVASPAALAIANWWADRVFGEASASTGDATIDALAVLSGRQGTPADSSKRDRFVWTLGRRVHTDLERSDFGVTLGVDYGPDPMLADAAREAGVSTSAFPWKTMTWTHREYVTASLGYGAAQVLVWSHPDWKRPPCGVGQYGDAPGYERLPWMCSAPRYHDSEHVFDASDPLCQHVYEGGFRAGERCLRSQRDGDVHDMSDRWAASHEFVA